MLCRFSKSLPKKSQQALLAAELRGAAGDSGLDGASPGHGQPQTALAIVIGGSSSKPAVRVRGMALISTRAISDGEELFQAYRLNPGARECVSLVATRVSAGRLVVKQLLGSCSGVLFS
jgi:hypothetical protein